MFFPLAGLSLGIWLLWKKWPPIVLMQSTTRTMIDFHIMLTPAAAADSFFDFLLWELLQESMTHHKYTDTCMYRRMQREGAICSNSIPSSQSGNPYTHFPAPATPPAPLRVTAGLSRSMLVTSPQSPGISMLRALLGTLEVAFPVSSMICTIRQGQTNKAEVVTCLLVSWSQTTTLL